MFLVLSCFSSLPVDFLEAVSLLSVSWLVSGQVQLVSKSLYCPFPLYEKCIYFVCAYQLLIQGLIHDAQYTPEMGYDRVVSELILDRRTKPKVDATQYA